MLLGYATWVALVAFGFGLAPDAALAARWAGETCDEEKLEEFFGGIEGEDPATPPDPGIRTAAALIGRQENLVKAAFLDLLAEFAARRPGDARWFEPRLNQFLTSTLKMLERLPDWVILEYLEADFAQATEGGAMAPGLSMGSASKTFGDVLLEIFNPGETTQDLLQRWANALNGISETKLYLLGQVRDASALEKPAMRYLNSVLAAMAHEVYVRRLVEGRITRYPSEQFRRAYLARSGASRELWERLLQFDWIDMHLDSEKRWVPNALREKVLTLGRSPEEVAADPRIRYRPRPEPGP